MRSFLATGFALVLPAVSVSFVAGCSSAGGVQEDGGPDGVATEGGGADADAGTIPLRYVFVLVKENHTFDSLYASYTGANGSLTAKTSTGQTIPLTLGPTGSLPSDLNHAHSAVITAYNNGGMNGFDLVPQPGSASPFTYYDRSLIPNYYTYADNFVLCDAFFSTVGGPSFPGYVSLMAAQSPAYGNPSTTTWGCGGGTVPVFDSKSCKTSTVAPCFTIPNLASDLPSTVTWREYGGTVSEGSFGAFEAWSSTIGAHHRSQSSFLSDVGKGDVANVTYIWGGNDDEHPPASMCPGENDTVTMVNAVMQSAVWEQSVFLVTYDDFGGFYDHVAPTIEACPSGGFYNTGFRLPLLVISPYARKGVVLHTPTEQASIPRLIEDVFGAPRMAATDPNARDEKAGDLLGAFDFTQAPRAPMLLTTRTCP